MTGSDADVGTSNGCLEAIVEHAVDAIVIADDDGRHVDANPAACALFGVEREELIGRRIQEFADDDYEAACGGSVPTPADADSSPAGARTGKSGSWSTPRAGTSGPASPSPSAGTSPIASPSRRPSRGRSCGSTGSRAW